MTTPSNLESVKAAALPPIVDAPADDRLFHEINLLKIEGRYFNFAPAQRGKKAKHPGEAVQPLPDLKEIKRRLKEGDKSVQSIFIVTPHPDRGQPGELAYKVLQVILKRISNTRFTHLDSVQFSFRELAQLCGRSTFGGKDVKELARAVDQLLTTVVTVAFYDKPSKKWGVHQFTVVNSVAYRGDDNHRPNDPEGAVMLHPLFIKSLQDGHFLCLNFGRFGALTEAITQALYKRLYFHFSNIHRDHSRETFPVFRKAYEDICAEWLSGLTPLKHRSRIMQEQLGRHLEQLKALRLIAVYDIVKRKDGVGFNLECLPGDAFFEDYQRFYRAELPVAPAAPLRLLPSTPSPSIPPETELARYFYQKKYGVQSADAAGSASPGDLDFARTLLQKHSFDDCRSFVDFALTEACSTDFDVRTFRGLAQYHAGFLAKAEARVRAKAEAEARRKQAEFEHHEQQLHLEYEAFKRNQLDQIRATLPADALSTLEATILAKLRQGPVRFKAAEERLAKIVLTDQLAHDYGVPTFDEWKSAAKRDVP